MKTSKLLQAFIDKASKTDSYWVERAKLEFAVALERQRRHSKRSYADVARIMTKSAAYISKVFRGDSNMTIESMVKLARATGGRLDIQVVDQATASALAWPNLTVRETDPLRDIFTTTGATIIYLPAANASQFHSRLSEAA